MRLELSNQVEAAQGGRIVRLSQPFGLCKLFRPLPKSAGPRPPLNEEYEYGDTLLFRFSAREALGAPEQTLLLALLELAYEQHRRNPGEVSLDGRNRSELAIELWSALNSNVPNWQAAAQPTVMLSCTWSELHRRCGAESVGGTVTDSRRASLVRLCEVTVWETNKATRAVRSGRLVSWRLGDDQRVHVALNHRLATALLGPGYAKVALSERLSLGSNIAMLVHAFLSSCLSPNRTMQIAFETLAERFWPMSSVPANPSTHRRRLSDIRAALRAIGRLDGWQVELKGAKATVHRRAAGDWAAGQSEQPVQGFERVRPSLRQDSARDMTSTGHFTAPDESYLERSFWLNPKQ